MRSTAVDALSNIHFIFCFLVWLVSLTGVQERTLLAVTAVFFCFVFDTFGSMPIVT